jgi:uncharacterized protein (DUF2252 family)
VLNFGLWATPERNLSFDLRYFDETLPGPFEWDVMRLTASLVVVAREDGLPPGEAEDAVTSALRAYRAKMRHYAGASQMEIWRFLDDASPAVDQTEHDHAQLVAAIADGSVPAEHVAPS